MELRRKIVTRNERAPRREARDRSRDADEKWPDRYVGIVELQRAARVCHAGVAVHRKVAVTAARNHDRAGDSRRLRRSGNRRAEARRVAGAAEETAAHRAVFEREISMRVGSSPRSGDPARETDSDSTLCLTSDRGSAHRSSLRADGKVACRDETQAVVATIERPRARRSNSRRLLMESGPTDPVPRPSRVEDAVDPLARMTAPNRSMQRDGFRIVGRRHGDRV